VGSIRNGTDERYLFIHWGEIELEDIDEHVLDLTQRGVRLAPDDDGTIRAGRHLVCPFDSSRLFRGRRQIR
jgi:hypothetical protein